jgi:hypothetical protein
MILVLHNNIKIPPGNFDPKELHCNTLRLLIKRQEFFGSYRARKTNQTEQFENHFSF